MLNNNVVTAASLWAVIIFLHIVLCYGQHFLKIGIEPHKVKFSNPYRSLKPDGVNLWYFKPRLFDLTEFVVFNISSLYIKSIYKI